MGKKLWNKSKVENIAKMLYNKNREWTVTVSKTAAKKSEKLPSNIYLLFEALLLDLIKIGPIQYEWPNYSKLSQGRFHCHFNYSFVVVWKVVNQEIRIIEVIYVGSREKAPY